MLLMFVLSGLGLDASSDGCLTTYQVSSMISTQPRRKRSFLSRQFLPLCNAPSVV